MINDLFDIFIFEQSTMSNLNQQINTSSIRQFILVIIHSLFETYFIDMKVNIYFTWYVLL